MDKTPEILVVGAGPTGLTLASELWRRCVPCRVIESLDAPSDQSKALAVHARTLELFKKMGIVDQFLQVGWKLDAFTVFDGKKKIVRMTFDQLDSPYPYVLSLPQFDTERFLCSHLNACGGTVEWGTTLIALKQEADHVVAVIRNKDGAEEQTRYHYLLACDGAHSPVRHMLNMPFAGTEYAEDWVLADINFETTLDTKDQYLFSGADGVAGFHVFTPDRARIFADMGTKHKADGKRHAGSGRKEGHVEPPTVESPTLESPTIEPPTIEHLQAFLDDRGPGTLRIVKVNWQSIHSVHRRQVSSYRDGRVFLAGDAAHVHSPASGQGMNTGIQDAYNLAWKLALSEQAMVYPGLLNSYSEERHAVGRGVLRMTDFFTLINIVRSPIAQKVRNVVGPLLAEQEIVNHYYGEAVAELSANYRQSPTVSEHIGGSVAAKLSTVVAKSAAALPSLSKLTGLDGLSGGPHAGDRAPDGAVVTAGGLSMHLFDLMRGTEHQLLLFEGAQTKVEDDAEPTPPGLESLIKCAEAVRQKYEKSGPLIKTYLICVNAPELAKTASETVAQEYGAANVRQAEYDIVFDPSLVLHHKYGCNHPSLYLIRPDGYVGFRSIPADQKALISYMEIIFAVH